MSDPGQADEAAAIAMVDAASLEIYPAVLDQLSKLAPSDERFALKLVTAAIRRAIGAWALACDGQDATLRELGDADGVRSLLHTPFGRWRIGPGPVIGTIQIWRLDQRKQPPELGAGFHFSGRRIFDDPAATAASDSDTSTDAFVGFVTLTLTDDQRRPWLLTRGHVDTLDHHLGYVYTSRRETQQEFARRTGSPAAPVPSAGPLRTYRLTSGFAEHDEKIGDSADVQVTLGAPPTRSEAEDLIWPAIWAVTVARLGEGDWRPSMNWLDLIELLEEPPAQSS